MKMRNRIILVIFLFLALMSGMIILGSNYIISSDYYSLEQSHAISEMGRVITLINTGISGRERIITDWAVWNDTYTYLEDPDNNSEFITDNIDETTFMNLDLDYIVFYAKDGKIISSSRFDRNTGLIEPVPDATLEYLSTAKNLLNTDNLSPHSGIVTSEGTPVLVVVQAVRQVSGEQLSNGVLLMGRKFDTAEVARLREVTSGSVAFLPGNSPEIPQPVLTLLGNGEHANNAIVVHFRNDSVIESYAGIRDLSGSNGIIIRLQEPKTYLQQGRETFSKIFIIVLTLTAFFGLIMYLSVNNFLSRLEQLDAFVKDIDQQGNLSKRFVLYGKDEITAIGDQINSMLTNLEQNRIRLTSAHQSVIDMNRKLNLLSEVTRHDISNKLTVLFSYLDLLKQESDNPRTLALMNKTEDAADAIKQSIEFAQTYEKIGTKEPLWQNLDRIMPRTLVPERITFHADPVTVEIYADALLEKVFYNLLDNSLRHGGSVSAIRVTVNKTGNNLTVVWEDNGIGIPAGEKERIFKRGQGHNTGLGLFLAREILSITGIRIQETGEPGKGARFEIRVPEGAYRYTGQHS